MADDGRDPGEKKSGGSTMDMSNLDWDAIRGGADSLPFQSQDGEAPARPSAPAPAEAPCVQPHRLGSTIAGWPQSQPPPEPPPPRPPLGAGSSSSDALRAMSELAPTLPQPAPSHHPANPRPRQQTLPSTSSSEFVPAPTPAQARTLNSLDLTPAVAFVPPPLPAHLARGITPPYAAPTPAPPRSAPTYAPSPGVSPSEAPQSPWAGGGARTGGAPTSGVAPTGGGPTGGGAPTGGGGPTGGGAPTGGVERTRGAQASVAHPPPSPAALGRAVPTSAPFAPPAAAPQPVAPAPAALVRSAVGFAWLWAQGGSSLRIRRHAPFKPLIDALEDRAVDTELDGAGADDDGVSVEDRREVFEVLARGQASAGTALRQALRSAVRDDGKFVAPLTLVDAELCTPFDERAELEAAITTVLPFVPDPEGDARSPLGDVVVLATRFLAEAPELCPGSTLAGFTRRIRHAFAEEERDLPRDHLDTTVERLLLQRRKYQTRLVFGGSQLRTLLVVGDCSEPLPAYLPDDLANQLPLFARFRVRLLAELHHRQDQDEASALALRGLALVRVLSLDT